MTNRLHLLPGILLILAVSACKPSFDNPKYDHGTADFTSYVALGNSLTAGYADMALYVDGQQNSYPAILARQFMLVGNNGVFKIPLIDALNAVRGVTPAPTMSDPLNTSCKLVLGYNTGCDSVTSLAPVSYAPDQAANVSFLNSVKANGPFNNTGVPGIKSFHLDDPEVGHLILTGSNPRFNPYYYRFASSPGFSTILGDALSSNPTFFTLWLGNNDVLGYAIAGGAYDAITPVDTFNLYLTNAVEKLTTNGAKGAIANIPEITDIPFFTTVPYNGLTLTSQAQVDALNTAYAPLGITFKLGANPFIVADAAAPGGKRQIKEGELICLTIPQDDLKCAGLGSTTAIPDEYWLSATEVGLVKTATAGYNATLKSLAEAHGLALVDFNAYFKTFFSGITFNGVDYGPEFVSGGAFSLDGIHPNQRGAALIANQYIQAINNKFGSSIPEVDVNSYPGIVFP